MKNCFSLSRPRTGCLLDRGTGNANGPVLGGLVTPGTLYSAAGTPLPICASATKGSHATVIDATTGFTYMGAYTSGGGTTWDVLCSYNGTTYAWLMH